MNSLVKDDFYFESYLSVLQMGQIFPNFFFQEYLFQDQLIYLDFGF